MQVRNFSETKLAAAEAVRVRKLIADRFNLGANGSGWATIDANDIGTLLAYIPIADVPFPVLEIIVKACRSGKSTG